MTQADELTKEENAGASAWAAVVAVALGIFTLITTELLPVGLLTPISGDLSISEGAAGLMITVPGLVAAASAPVVAVTLTRWDRRTILTTLVVLVAGANVVCALVDTYAVFLLARILVGVGMGGFWAIAGSLAPRLVPDRHVPRATAIIFSGVSSATVLGVPLGTLLGDWLTWRAALLGVAALGLVSFVLLFVLLPSIPARNAVRFGDLPAVLRRNGQVRVVLILAVLFVAGHFSAFTFVRPLLTDVAGFTASLTGLLLLAYGAAGITGNFLAAAGRDARHTLFTITTLLTLALGTFALLGGLSGVAIGALILWGLTFGGVSVTLQTWLLRTAPDATEAATALYVCVFNLSIAIGASVGGIVADALPVVGTAWVGAGFVLLTLVPLALAGRR